MTGIDKPLKVPLLIKRGKSALFTVQPLQASAPKKPTRDWMTEAFSAGGDIDLLRALYTAAQTAGAPKKVLDAIRGLATDQTDEPAPV